MQLKSKIAELRQKMEWWQKVNKIGKEIWQWVISTLLSPTTVGEEYNFRREIFMGLKLTHWWVQVHLSWITQRLVWESHCFSEGDVLAHNAV